VINIFQLNYDNRLHSWYELRTNLKTSDIKTKCVEIDNWWQNAPMVNHHLHILDISNWPSPWELLVENTYCSVAKALGMCYTMLLLNITDIKMVEATDMQGEDLVLVLVDDAKYILNYWPDTVLSNKLSNFTIKRNIDITDLELKIK
jgi:hypothetical protein